MADLAALVNRLADMAGTPDKADTWHAQWAQLIGQALHQMGADAERVVVRWMQTQRWPPKPVELREVHAAIVAERQGDAEDEAPAGCLACGASVGVDGRLRGGRGSLLLRWVEQREDELVELTRAVLCDCALGAWKAAHHAKGPGKGTEAHAPVRMKTAAQVAHVCARGFPGLVWWCVEDSERPWAEQRMPADLRAALAAQLDRRRVAAIEHARSVRAGETRSGKARRPELDPYAPPIQPRGAIGAAERAAERTDLWRGVS